jgi:outer membrane protein OmpA-like peptidoglycan-associated protein/tetratricopeptide (TPR) repeat protein
MSDVFCAKIGYIAIVELFFNLKRIPSMKKQICLCGLIFIFFCSQAQTLKEHLTKGDRFYERKDYEHALDDYLGALAAEPDNALTNFKAGVCYLNLGNSGQAVVLLAKAFQLNAHVDPFVEYQLAVACQGDHRFAEAREHFVSFRKGNKKMAAVATKKIKECENADSLIRLPARAEVRKLGPEINTPFAEHSPLLSPDGNTLIFTSTRTGDNYQAKSNTNYEDVYISRRAGNTWGVPTLISPNINVRYNEAAVSLSPDGKTLFLYYEEGQGDIYKSTFENGEWTKPVALNAFINNPKYRESTACLSADGKKLYFASNRAGGKGGLDIYVSKLGANGDWGRPTNLGSTINTRGDEDSPFPDADGVTLYFSSNGHPGLGDNDIFKAKITNGKWTRPENLGYPINTTAYDGFFTLLSDGKTAYYSAHPGTSATNTDIFVATLLSAEATTTPALSESQDDVADHNDHVAARLRGRVTDLDDGHPVSATVTLVDNSTNSIVESVSANADGRFEMSVPRHGNYGVTAKRDGYLFHSMNLDLPPGAKYREIETEIALMKPKVGSKVVLKNVFFDTNESSPREESMTELENIREILARNPGWRVQINGHTDSVGDPKSNLSLSLRRAQAVVEYLVKHGINSNRLEAKGYGAERPLVSNDDEEEGRQINRRTEIEIIK